MKNQWTPISEKMDAAHQNARDLSHRSKDHPKGRKIPIIFGSLGVFLMLVGASPFLFGEKNSERYLADLTTTTAEKSVDFSAEPTSVDENFDLDLTLPAEDQTGTDTINTQEAEEVDVSLDGIPLQKGEIQEEAPVSLKEEIPKEINPPKENIHAAAPTEEEVVTRKDIEDAKITAEVVDFPKNTHVGAESDPIVFENASEDEELENFFKGENEALGETGSLHAAASQENAGTGTPLLPLLAVSGLAAVFLRRRKK